MERYFETGDAPQAVSEGRVLRRRHARVRNDDGVAAQLGLVLLQKRRQALAAHFFLALDHERQVAWQLRARRKIGLDSLEMGQVLPFVVAGSASKQRTACNPRLERRRLPKVHRLGRLHVIMAIYHKMRAAVSLGLGRGRLGNHDGVALRGAKPGVQADLPAVLDHPLRTRLQVLPMLRLGGDARKAHILAQFINSTGLVLPEVVNYTLHSERSSRERPGRKGQLTRGAA